MANVVVLGTSDTIIAQLAGSPVTPATYATSWVDTTGDTTSSHQGTIADANEATIVDHPAADLRQVDFIRIYNEDTASVICTVQIANGASRYTLGKWTILAGGWIDVLGTQATTQGGSGAAGAAGAAGPMAPGSIIQTWTYYGGF